MTQGWKKAVSVMLCAAMILSVSSVMISADDENKPAAENVIEQTQPENENTNETPENNTTEGETPDAENEANKETSEAVKSVIAQLEALPKLDDLTETTDTEKLKSDVESAKAEFDALTEAEKADISEELKGNLADLDIFVTNFIVNTPTAIPETESDKIVGDQDGIMTLEEPIALTGDGTEDKPYEVGSADELAEAVKLGGYIKLISNIDVLDQITIDSGKNIILDMNGQTLSVAFSDNNKNLIVNNATLTIKGNGTFDATQATSYKGFIDNYGILTVENGTFQMDDKAMIVHLRNQNGAKAVINGGNFSGGATIIRSYKGSDTTINDGNFTNSIFPAIDVNGETLITGGDFTNTSCSGCSSNWGYTIRSGVDGDNDAKLTISPSDEGSVTVTGVQGALTAAAGIMEVYGGTFKTVACQTHGEEKAFYALYVAGESGEVVANIYGGNFESASRWAAMIGNKNDGGSKKNAIANFYGGTFKSMDQKGEILKVDSPIGDLTVSGGTYLNKDGKTNVENLKPYLDPSCEITEDGTVIPLADENVVATVDGKGYATVQDAINNANGKTVVLNKDTTETVEVPQGITVTLDLNGKTLTEEKVLNVKGNLTVKDSAAGQPSVDGNYNVSYQSGKIVNIDSERENDAVTVIVRAGGKFTLESGTLESKKNYTVEITDNAHAVINGGYQVAQEGGPTVHGSGAVLDVNGGVIEGKDNSAVAGNGTPGLGGTTINITGGTLIGRIQAAGYVANAIYHPQSGVLNITGGTIYAENGVGILMRNGELNVSGNPSIIATGNVSGKVGDNDTKVPSHAVVFNHIYPEGVSKDDTSGRGVSITGGEFISDDGLPSVSVTQDGVQVKDFISGGSFSNHVDPQYLSNNLNAELYSPNRNPDAPFSYYPSVEDAKDEAEQFGGTVTDMDTGNQEVIPAPSNPDPKPEKPSKPSNGGSSNGGSSNSGSSDSGTTVDKEEEDYNEFWDKVIDRINKADEGDTITVHAGDYDKMPNKVMKALKKNGVGLIIKYNGGEIEIPAGEAVNKSNKLFWSFKELGNYVFAVEDNNEQNDKQDNEQCNGSENNVQSNTTTEQKPSGTVETKPNPQTGSEDYVGLAAALAVTAGVAATVIGAKKKK